MRPPSPWSSIPCWTRPLYVLSHPALLLPIACVAIAMFGSYSPAEITQARLPLFLQGSTDWGDSNIFAVTVVLYVVFGILGGWHLTLRLAASSRLASILRECIRTLSILKYHVALFVTFGVLTWSEDHRIAPNDFRNMFLLAALLYTTSVSLVVWLSRRPMHLALKLLAAPAAIYLWLVLGSDGNTAKAGQQRYSGRIPRGSLVGSGTGSCCSGTAPATRCLATSDRAATRPQRFAVPRTQNGRTRFPQSARHRDRRVRPEAWSPKPGAAGA